MVSTRGKKHSRETELDEDAAISATEKRPIPEVSRGPTSIDTLSLPSSSHHDIQDEILSEQTIIAKLGSEEIDFESRLWKLLIVIFREDKYHIFAQEVPGERLTFRAYLLKKLREKGWKSWKVFSDDFSSMFSKMILSKPCHLRQDALLFLNYIKSIISMEERKSGVPSEEEDEEEDLNTNQKRRLRSHSKKRQDNPVAVNPEGSRLALFKRTTEGGFIFSSLCKSLERNISLELAGDINSLIILPYNGDKQLSISSFKNVVSKRNVEVEKLPKKKRVLLGGKPLDHGVFSSFSPSIDTYGASCRYELIGPLLPYMNDPEVLACSSGPPEQPSEQKNEEAPTISSNQEPEPLSNLLSQVCSPETMNLLENQIPGNEMSNGIEVEIKETEPTSLPLEEVQQESVPCQQSHEELVSNCGKMLIMLEDIQEQRCLSGETNPSSLERDLVANLQSDLAFLLSQYSPKTLCNEVSQVGKHSITSKDASYMGTLPANKSFGFPSNMTSRSSFPMSANSIPYYHRDKAIPSVTIPKLLPPSANPYLSSSTPSAIPLSISNPQGFTQSSFSSVNTPSPSNRTMNIPYPYLSATPSQSLAATPSRLYYGSSVVPSRIDPAYSVMQRPISKK